MNQKIQYRRFYASYKIRLSQSILTEKIKYFLLSLYLENQLMIQKNTYNIIFGAITKRFCYSIV